MEYYIIILVVLFISIWIVYDKCIKSNKTQDFSKATEYTEINIKTNRIQDSNNKPDLKYISNYIKEENRIIFSIVLEELKKIGTPDFFWRGIENGWVLSITEDEAQHGSFILTKEKIIGQTWSKNFAFNSSGTGYDFDKYSLETKEDIKNFLYILKQRLGIIET